MSNPILLYVNGVEIGDAMQWDLSCEEILGASGRATCTVQDRGGTLNLQPHDDLKAVVASSGWVIFRGETLKARVALRPGFPWKRWVLDCTDYNAQLPARLVGAVDGVTVIDNGFGNFAFVDPFAASSLTDRATIQALFDHYFRIGAEAAETDTYVGEYLAPGSFVPIFWNNTTLRGSLDDLSALVAVNIQDWLDPDLFVHHVSLPAWADLAGILAGTGSGLPLLFPASPTALLPVAPREITDVVTDPSTQIGCRDLSFELDGAIQPQQVHVKGATGYTWDTGAPPVGVPAVTVPDKMQNPTLTYLLTVNGATDSWTLNSSGYAVAAGSISAGGPWYVRTQIVPHKPTPPHTGGSFWVFTSGPHIGRLLSQHTNSLGYGSITVTTIPIPPGPPPDPVIGVGGSGWVGGDQDPALRQAYVEAATSTTQSDRDAIGAQALYRGATPTLRGSLVIGGDHQLADGTVYPTPDGWRVGQVVKITDARLPTALNGRYFIIQRVATSLYAGTDARRYTIDWGDGAVQRLTTTRAPKVPVPDPAVQLYVVLADSQPAPGSQQVVTAQLVSGAGTAWSIPNRIVNWTLLAVDASYAPVPGEGTLDPPVSTTDGTGKARTTFTAGAIMGLQYFVYVDSPAI